MKKKIILLLSVILCVLCLTGCRDYISMHSSKADDLTIYSKDGYYYDHYEKYTIDEDTVAITVYFKQIPDSDWDTVKSE